MRITLIEAVCLVAIGATVVELHDGHRLARTGTLPETALATAAKPAAAAGQPRSQQALNVNSVNSAASLR